MGRFGNVATLIAGSGGRPAIAGIAAELAAALRPSRAPDWLSPGEACDIAFCAPPAEAEAIARSLIGGAAIDVVMQPAAGRRKRLLIADMESTIIENEMLDELADFLGLRGQVSEITRRAMNGEIDFVGALEARVALLRGLPATALDAAAGHMRLMPGATALVATMRRNGAFTALISGGFTVFAERIGRLLGFDHVTANRLDLAAGSLAGTVGRPIVTRETKRETLTALAAARRVALAETVAIGDGANDLPMLQTAGLGIAFRAKPAVAAAARWRIDHADLTAILFAQGYRAAEIAGRVGSG